MANYSTTPKTPLEKELDAALHKMLVWNDELSTKVKHLQTKLDGMLAAFEKGGSLALLQEIGADRTLPADTRIRALSAAVGYERAKPPSAEAKATFKLYDFLEAKRLEQLEAKTINQPPKPPVLASDRGGEAIGPEDPAA